MIQCFYHWVIHPRRCCSCGSPCQSKNCVQSTLCCSTSYYGRSNFLICFTNGSRDKGEPVLKWKNGPGWLPFTTRQAAMHCYHWAQLITRLSQDDCKLPSGKGLFSRPWGGLHSHICQRHQTKTPPLVNCYRCLSSERRYFMTEQTHATTPYQP